MKTTIGQLREEDIINMEMNSEGVFVEVKKEEIPSHAEGKSLYQILEESFQVKSSNPNNQSYNLFQDNVFQNKSEEYLK